MHCLECIIAVVKWNLYTMRKQLDLKFAGHYQQDCNIKGQHLQESSALSNHATLLSAYNQ